MFEKRTQLLIAFGYQGDRFHGDDQRPEHDQQQQEREAQDKDKDVGGRVVHTVSEVDAIRGVSSYVDFGICTGEGLRYDLLPKESDSIFSGFVIDLSCGSNIDPQQSLVPAYDGIEIA